MIERYFSRKPLYITKKVLMEIVDKNYCGLSALKTLLYDTNTIESEADFIIIRMEDEKFIHEFYHEIAVKEYLVLTFIENNPNSFITLSHISIKDIRFIFNKDSFCVINKPNKAIEKYL